MEVIMKKQLFLGFLLMSGVAGLQANFWHTFECIGGCSTSSGIARKKVEDAKFIMENAEKRDRQAGEHKSAKKARKISKKLDQALSTLEDYSSDKKNAEKEQDEKSVESVGRKAGKSFFGL